MVRKVICQIFVGLTLYMMQQIASGKHQMAHYAFTSGIMNLGVMLPGMMSGWVCEKLGFFFNAPGGYEPFFIFVLIATIPAFLITWFAPFKEKKCGLARMENPSKLSSITK